MPPKTRGQKAGKDHGGGQSTSRVPNQANAEEVENDSEAEFN